MIATPWFRSLSAARSLLAFLITLLTLPAFAQTQTPIFPVLPVDFAVTPSSTYAYADFNGDGQVDEAFPNGNLHSNHHTTTALLRNLSGPLQGIALASFLLLTLFPAACSDSIVASRAQACSHSCWLLACSRFQAAAHPHPPTLSQIRATPTGAQTITVTTADSSGNLSHSINFQVTVQ